ncbi:MAG: D-sedoheptulose 7-phosphate isomerase [Elusimicrobiota bacterium]
MKDIFEKTIREHAEILKSFELKKDIVLKISKCLINCLKKGHKILLCGNGGSAADAQHMAAEIVGRFLKDRKGYPAIALTTDTSIITSVSNDYSFEKIFERQIEALACKGDVLIGFSTSGSSINIVKAFEKARDMGVKTIGILGKPGKIYYLSDITFTINGSTARVQEIHSILIHILCELIEENLLK